jgi:hypothetical protein
MKLIEINEEINPEEVAITLNVDNDVIKGVCNGDIRYLSIDINEDNQFLILQNIEGNLILVMDEIPTTFRSCYLYNNGEFPYAIKDTLSFVVLKSDEDTCLTKIIDVDVEASTRFRFQGPGEPSIEDPNGDCCIWMLNLELVPIPQEPRYYLMRWNPSISSFKEKDYKEYYKHMNNGMFKLDWSIYDWQEARRGDFFYMMRTGDDKAGIVFCGQFITDPYPADDWAGSTKRRMYVDMICMTPAEPGQNARIPLEKLQENIPEIDWSKGHSGELLSEDIATKLGKLLKEI